jgi:hypothetical protein
VQIQDACAKLLIIFVKFYFGIFLRCQAKVLLSTCPFSIFRFDVHVTPVIFTYMYIVDGCI